MKSSSSGMIVDEDDFRIALDLHVHLRLNLHLQFLS